MYQQTHNFSLKSSNTFGISAIAKHYLTVDSPEELIRFLRENNPAGKEKRLFLGAGSNLLFVNNFDGLIIHPEIPGIRLITENKDIVEVEAGAGVVWDNFVDSCVKKGWGGVENLSLIPGNVGAVPVQNIGAYGAEVESVIAEVRGVNLDTLENKSFNPAECKFGYRTSIFKVELKEQFMVTSVVFRLSKQPEYRLEYGALETEVCKFGEKNLQNIRKAVIAIRESKLPDPMKIGNAGSFFKNPVVSEAAANALKNVYPDLPVYPVGSGLVKIAAGWIIEKAGWKGKSIGNAAVHDKQALVLINNGGASGKEIFELSEIILKDVLLKFNIELEREVQVIGD
ncbi:MAG: UDP-N-acetylmuramate dehydrogenase [Bacteroidia bacterium]|nr:UDP-N-acetylmuramate dehydrogenase [Bacteroidia bacterium]